MSDEVISWKFVEENYPDFHTSEDIQRYLYLKNHWGQKDSELSYILMHIYQKAITNYMNKVHAEIKRSELEKDIEGFI